jgi:hypothetical protein
VTLYLFKMLGIRIVGVTLGSKVTRSIISVPRPLCKLDPVLESQRQIRLSRTGVSILLMIEINTKLTLAMK